MDRPSAIVLDAGPSRRLGQPKQLVLLHGEPLLRRAVRLALEAGCSPVVIVLGACDQPCRDALGGLTGGPSGSAGALPGPWRVVWNPDWAEGMSTSLRAGIAALSAGFNGPPASTLVMLCDQVRLTAASLQRLLRTHAETAAPVTAAYYAGNLGVPAIFRAELLPALAALTGDRGARRLLAEWADRAAAVDMPEAGFELDTPQDLAELA